MWFLRYRVVQVGISSGYVYVFQIPLNSSFLSVCFFKEIKFPQLNQMLGKSLL